jgi:hypothetical protein
MSQRRVKSMRRALRAWVRVADERRRFIEQLPGGQQSLAAGLGRVVQPGQPGQPERPASRPHP